MSVPSSMPCAFADAARSRADVVSTSAADMPAQSSSADCALIPCHSSTLSASWPETIVSVLYVLCELASTHTAGVVPFHFMCLFVLPLRAACNRTRTRVDELSLLVEKVGDLTLQLADWRAHQGLDASSEGHSRLSMSSFETRADANPRRRAQGRRRSYLPLSSHPRSSQAGTTCSAAASRHRRRRPTR